MALAAPQQRPPLRNAPTPAPSARGAFVGSVTPTPSFHPFVQAKLRIPGSDMGRASIETPGRTNYAFDTGRATAAHLADPDVVRRFNNLDDQRLSDYRDRSSDLVVIEFIGDILDAREIAKRAVVHRIVANYAEAQRKGTDQPGGACFAVARERVETATKEVAGESLTEGLAPDDIATFDRLWGVHITPKVEWLKLPEEFRGKGSAGAIAFGGKGQLVDQNGIWSGGLEPGAVIQTWKKASDFTLVKDGDRPTDYGHSFIFIRYVRQDGKITGIRIADQGFQSEDTLKKSDYGFWVGANIRIAGARPFVKPRMRPPEF